MTLEEAKTAMIHGEKITHEYFSEDEYMFYSEGKFKFEDGVIIDWSLYFLDRKEPMWKNEYTIYE